jgi:hypothetical protein
MDRELRKPTFFENKVITGSRGLAAMCLGRQVVDATGAY